MSETGIRTIASPFPVRETIDKLEQFIRKNGATIYARIDQQLELGKSGITVPSLEFIMFGNPAVGGKAIQANPVSALDLPLKILAWEDSEKKVWISSNEAKYLAVRHQLSSELAGTLDLEQLISKALN